MMVMRSRSLKRANCPVRVSSPPARTPGPVLFLHRTRLVEHVERMRWDAVLIEETQQQLLDRARRSRERGFADDRRIR